MIRKDNKKVSGKKIYFRLDFKTNNIPLTGVNMNDVKNALANPFSRLFANDAIISEIIKLIVSIIKMVFSMIMVFML